MPSDNYYQVLATYKHRCKQRDIKWGLDRDVFFSLIIQDCFYCGQKPRNRNKLSAKVGYVSKYTALYNGLDRVRNTKGYILSNVVPCCKTCNSMKSKMSLKEFLKHVFRIYEKVSSKT